MINVINDPRVTGYAMDVVSGKIKMGRLHTLACKRHLRDLERQNTPEFPYIYRPDLALEMIDFAETLTIAEGEEPKPVKLIPSQGFDLGCTFGWVKASSGYRRFRRRYKSVGRQNGKSFENGIMGTKIAAFSGYNLGKLFTVATKKRQAKIAWQEMQRFIEVDEDLSEYFEIKEYLNLITALNTGCTIEYLSKETGLDEGFRAIYASVDEIHQHPNNQIYKKMYNGTKNLPETLISMITTRGDDVNSFCYEMDSYCIEVLEGRVTAEDLFVDIYSIDDNDDPFDVDNVLKANPLYAAQPDGREKLKAEAQTAKDMGGDELKDFLIKTCNIWLKKSDDAFVNPDDLTASMNEETLEEYRGRSCTVGIDLSSGGDLTTLHLEFENPGDEYFNYSHSFMPKGRLMEHVQTDIAPYDLWETAGLITATGSEVDFKNNYKVMVEHLRYLVDEYELKLEGIGIDPHNADGVIPDLEEFDCPVIIIPQSARSLNSATQDVQLLIKSHRYHYGKEQELLTWSFKNATTVKNSFKEIKIDKKEGKGKRYKRIDPCDAAINARAVRLILKANQEEELDANAEMTKYLELMGWN